MKDQVKTIINLKLAASIAKYKSFYKKLGKTQFSWETNFPNKDIIKMSFEVFRLVNFWNLTWDFFTDLLWHCHQCQRKHNNIDLCYLPTVSKWFFKLGTTFQALFWLIFLPVLCLSQFEKQRRNTIGKKSLFSSHPYISND